MVETSGKRDGTSKPGGTAKSSGTAKRDDVSSEAVAPLMAAMAEGSPDALFELIDRFRPELERVVGGILSSLHRSDVARSPSEVASLVVSAGFVLFARAPGWRSDGALPWVWAYRSIRQAIVADIGHPSVEFDPARFEEPSAPVQSAREHGIDLIDLSERHDGIAAWVAAVEDVANERDQGVHLEYQMQKRLGDPSPAITVADMFKLSPDNVRQIDRRVRQRLERSPYASVDLLVAMNGSR